MNEGSTVVAVLGALATIISVVTLLLKSRGENKNAAATVRTTLDARIDARIAVQLETAWARIDELSAQQEASELKETRRSGAISRILRAIAAQWPTGGGPDLDPSDIKEIEDTVPYQWIRDTRKEK